MAQAVLPLLTWPEKDPGETLDYSLDFTALFEAGPVATGDTISSLLWTIPAGLTKHTEVASGNLASVTVSGGESGARYRLECRAVSVQGRIGILGAVLPVRRRKDA